MLTFVSMTVRMTKPQDDARAGRREGKTSRGRDVACKKRNVPFLGRF